MLRPVTAGLDGSTESRAAALWAAREAQRRRFPLRLMHAETPALPHPAPEPYGADTRRRWLGNALRQTESDIVRRYPGLTVTLDIVAETAVQALLAATGRSQMLVLGAGPADAHDFPVGSVGLATVMRATRPVVFVRGREHSADRGPVVLGLDLRHGHQPLVGFAFDAAAGSGSPLRVVHAGHRAEALPPAEALRPWREKYPEVEVDERTTAGPVEHDLLLAAQEATLVVVGRWTGRPPGDTRVGPVTHAVLHHCPAPVAVVPHE
jgi:nucleotide-binding universal stress UspA family protein